MQRERIISILYSYAYQLGFFILKTKFDLFLEKFKILNSWPVLQRQEDRQRDRTASCRRRSLRSVGAAVGRWIRREIRTPSGGRNIVCCWMRARVPSRSIQPEAKNSKLCQSSPIFTNSILSISKWTVIMKYEIMNTITPKAMNILTKAAD